MTPPKSNSPAEPSSEREDDHIPIPAVSLISSWHVPLRARVQDARPAAKPSLPALEIALRNRVALHDLYFLAESDLPWYAVAAGQEPSSVEGKTPLEFAAELLPGEICAIARKLNELLSSEAYRGPLVGFRPRFTALATYWPFISLPKEEDCESNDGRPVLWPNSVKAIRNSLYLASELGCRHVEIVGGSAIPEHIEARKREKNLESYRLRRLNRLAAGLRDVFDKDFDTLFDLETEKAVAIPFLCLEIEPGRSYLVSGLNAFEEVHTALQRAPRATRPGRVDPSDQLLLNADIAHILLSDGVPNAPHSDEVTGKLEIFKQIARDNRLGHFHLSDHARSHAADLNPGIYHFYDHYEPWLRAAIAAMREKRNKFSGTIAIELEACNDIHEAARAIGKITRWLEEIRHRIAVDEKQPEDADSGEDPQVIRGALLVVDIGNSTSAYIRKGSTPWGARKIADAVSSICRCVQANRGSVLSFTGDGVIALFDDRHFSHPGAAVHATLLASEEIRKAMLGKPASAGKSSEPISLRAALHFGDVFVPSSGHLRHQAIGRDVIITARLCDWIGKTVEPAVPESTRQMIVAATKPFWEKLAPVDQAFFALWGPPTFKGLDNVPEIYLDNRYTLPLAPQAVPTAPALV